MTENSDQLEQLSGGNMNCVRRDGDTVLRQTGPWSPFVHQLLRHLTAHNFTAAPVLLETTDTTERLTFLDGEAGNDPLKPYMQSAEILVEAAQLLRRSHDITATLEVDENATFQLPVNPAHAWEVICHNDFAPYNCVFQDQHLTGIIDFDTAGPGTRLWDIAYAVYRFAPLAHDDHSRGLGWQPIPDRGQRLQLFCDTYGLDNQTARAALIDTVIERLEYMINFMRHNALNVEHIPLYQRDQDYIRANQAEFSRVLVK